MEGDGGFGEDGEDEFAEDEFGEGGGEAGGDTFDDDEYYDEYYDEFDEAEIKGELAEVSLNDIIDSNAIKKQIRLPTYEYKPNNKFNKPFGDPGMGNYSYNNMQQNN